MLGWFKKKFGKTQKKSPGDTEDRLQPHEQDAVAAESEQVVSPEVELDEHRETQPVQQPDDPGFTKTSGELSQPPEDDGAPPPEIESEEESEPPEAVTEEQGFSIEIESAGVEDALESETTAVEQDDTEEVPLSREVIEAAAVDEEAKQYQDVESSTEAAALPEPDVEEPAVASQPVDEVNEVAVLKPDATLEAEKTGSKSMFKRLQDRLSKTRDSFVYRLDTLFLGKKEIDRELFDELEEILITADLGVKTTLELLDEARKQVKRDSLSDPQALKQILRDRILSYLQDSDQPAELVMPESGPFVIMVVGVNGVGKTTSIGKIAAKFVRSGQSALLIAGDTFRAAAIDQIKIWGERVGVEVIAREPGSDPSAVVFDGLEYGIAHDRDVILIDTAGRLHTSVNLMEELKKIRRVIGKKYPGAPHEVMLVLDATTGQNGISQAKLFHEAVGVTGLTMTKLDGTAKGGIVANVCREIGIPVRFIGIGEQMDDLRDFSPSEFVDALFAQSPDQ